jgi:transcriptional regulator with XRE-family HTH domain
VNILDNINNRIGILIETLNIKKVRFAERLKIDQSYVTQLTNGKRNPSDRTISDICREFNVREEWLRDGKGEMFLDFTDEFSKAAIALSNDAFVRSLIIEYCKLDEDSKQLFKGFIHKLSDDMRNQKVISVHDKSATAMTKDEAETTYIKSRSKHVQKTAQSALNTTAEIENGDFASSQ